MKGNRAHSSWLPHRRTIPYTDITKATIDLVSAGRGGLPVIRLHLKDGSTDIVSLSPFTKGGCRQLVLLLREHGVEVWPRPGLLGKGFR